MSRLIGDPVGRLPTKGRRRATLQTFAAPSTQQSSPAECTSKKSHNPTRESKQRGPRVLRSNRPVNRCETAAENVGPNCHALGRAGGTNNDRSGGVFSVKLGVALPGPYRSEALAILEHCKAAGMSWKRAYAVACFASEGRKGMCWKFQSTVARFTGYNMRTIQRAVRQAKGMGVLVSRRLRRGERPPGARQPITCGGALRRFIAWGKPKAQRLALRARYALRECGAGKPRTPKLARARRNRRRADRIPQTRHIGRRLTLGETRPPLVWGTRPNGRPWVWTPKTGGPGVQWSAFRCEQPRTPLETTPARGANCPNPWPRRPSQKNLEQNLPCLQVDLTCQVRRGCP